ncbi:hypothetical protein V6N13_053146 [Hibiscus sabdariffa]
MFEVFVPPSCMLMLVNWLIKLDVKIGGDVVLLDNFSEGIFKMELEDVDGIVASTEPNVGEFRLSCKSLVGSNIAQLLDNLLVITLEHLESCERKSCLAKSDNEQWRRAEVEKPDKNLQNLKSSFYPLDIFVHPYGTVQPMNKCTFTNMKEMLYGDKQGKRYQIWLDCN